MVDEEGNPMSNFNVMVAITEKESIGLSLWNAGKSKLIRFTVTTDQAGRFNIRHPYGNTISVGAEDYRNYVCKGDNRITNSTPEHKRPDTLAKEQIITVVKRQ